MRIKLLLSSLLVIFGIQINAQNENSLQVWKNDPAHSRLAFEVKHLTVSYVDGYFANFEIKVTTHETDLSNMLVELTAQTASINTGVKARDNHLRTADFFNVEQFPTLTFKSTKVLTEGNANGKLIGDLTILGVTKPVSLDITYFGTIPNPMAGGQEVAGFRVEGKINRSDFGLGEQFSNSIIGDEVKIIANLEFSPISE